MGYDWGAGIALSFAVLYPARVKNVISFLPSFSETPNTQLNQMKASTMILWVKRDTNHSWKHFKTLARKIPNVQIEFVESPIMIRLGFIINDILDFHTIILSGGSGIFMERSDRSTE